MPHRARVVGCVCVCVLVGPACCISTSTMSSGRRSGRSRVGMTPRPENRDPVALAYELPRLEKKKKSNGTCDKWN